MAPDRALVDRFTADLDSLAAPDARVGVAVSGGPDSLALLLLTAAARPGLVEAATVDHALRPESRAEAETVARLCERLGVPHVILTTEWEQPPRTAIQERARDARYGLLSGWLAQRGISALLTGHHAEDQAETVLMRLARGAGVRGLAGMRPEAPLPAALDMALLRPLLGWRRQELEQICAKAGVSPIADPSNEAAEFERVRVRKALAGLEWLPTEAVARSAANLAAADEALDWAASQEWNRSVTARDPGLSFDPGHSPREIRRRVIRRILARLATEGASDQIRGRELDRVMAELEAGTTVTLRGVRCTGGAVWHFAGAPARRLR